VADVGLSVVALPTGVGVGWAVANNTVSSPINDRLKRLLGLADPHEVLLRGDYTVELALVGLAAQVVTQFAAALDLPPDRMPPLAPESSDGTAIERPMEQYHGQLAAWANTLPNAQAVDARALIETIANGSFATYLANNAEH
jgi:hypothetical protein